MTELLLACDPEGPPRGRRFEVVAPLVGDVGFRAVELLGPADEPPAARTVVEAPLVAAPEGEGGRTGHLVVLLYGLGASADVAEYERFLREEDNPFFNRVPGVARYENRRVARTLRGDLGWPWLDLLHVDEDDGAVERVLGDPGLREFQAGWLARWAIDPAAQDPTVNFRAAEAREV